MTKWTKLCPAVARSLEEAGENLNREFRRRTQTQASFSTEASAVTLPFGLVAFGQIEMREINGYPHMSELASTMAKAA